MMETSLESENEDYIRIYRNILFYRYILSIDYIL